MIIWENENLSLLFTCEELIKFSFSRKSSSSVTAKIYHVTHRITKIYIVSNILYDLRAVKLAREKQRSFQ